MLSYSTYVFNSRLVGGIVIVGNGTVRVKVGLLIEWIEIGVVDRVWRTCPSEVVDHDIKHEVLENIQRSHACRIPNLTIPRAWTALARALRSLSDPKLEFRE